MHKAYWKPLFATVALTALAFDTAGYAAGITAQPYGKIKGQSVSRYTLTNQHGIQIVITNFGGTVLSLKVPDRSGHKDDIALAYGTLPSIETDPAGTFFGALIGRYGNRIAKGHLKVDGKTYQLAINNSPNSLHGGKVGFNKRVWTATPGNSPDGPTLTLSYDSPAGEENYPGTLKVHVTYTLTNSDALRINYSAMADADTVVNLTNHTYFNLAGEGHSTILGHRMQINADKFTPIDPTSIPTGKLQPVAGTPFDFRQPTQIGTRINKNNTQLKNGKGYDHNFVINRQRAGDLEMAARVTEPSSGRVLEVWTTEPGVQFYSGNFINVHRLGKNGKSYPFRSGFCLETQHFPDSPNHPNFPSTTLKPGQIYHSVTEYRFAVGPKVFKKLP